MPKALPRTALLSAALIMAGAAPAAAHEIKVVASIKPVHSLAAAVMKGVGEPTLLMKGAASPHTYAMKPSDARALSDADVVIWVGEGIETFLTKPLETVAGDAKVVKLIETPGVRTLSFREGATFDAHDHDHGAHGHDEHDHGHGHDHAEKKDEHGHGHAEHKHDEHKHDHAEHKHDHAEHKHDEHKHDHAEHKHDHAEHKHDAHDHGHGHGEHAFEWAGVFDLAVGTYKWSFAKVDGNYADPAMKMVILESGDIEASEEKAEHALEDSHSDAKNHNDVLVAQDKAYTLNFDQSKDMTVFTVEIKKAGKYTFFTEHMPFEFEASEHFFKDLARADIEPIAQEPDADHHGHGHGHDGHHGHAHGEVDAHIWLDPMNAKAIVRDIQMALSEADPHHAAAYRDNAQAATAAIDAMTKEVAATVAPVKDRGFIVFHDAYRYFEERFGLEAVGSITVSPEVMPGAARVSEIRERVTSLDAACVFSEPQFEPKLVGVITEGTPAKSGVLDPLGADIPAGPDMYNTLLRNLAASFVDCLTPGS